MSRIDAVAKFSIVMAATISILVIFTLDGMPSDEAVVLLPMVLVAIPLIVWYRKVEQHKPRAASVLVSLVLLQLVSLFYGLVALWAFLGHLNSAGWLDFWPDNLFSQACGFALIIAPVIVLAVLCWAVAIVVENKRRR